MQVGCNSAVASQIAQRRARCLLSRAQPRLRRPCVRPRTLRSGGPDTILPAARSRFDAAASTRSFLLRRLVLDLERQRLLVLVLDLEDAVAVGLLSGQRLVDELLRRQRRLGYRRGGIG